MRTLKFRVWLGDHWVDWLPSVKTHGEYNEVFIDPDQYETHGGKFYIEQYTGLKDKNGKEVYEGDIVKFDDVDPEANTEDPGKVVFKYGTFVIKCADGGFYYDENQRMVPLGYVKPSLYEVIGNIHENPELLGDTDDTNMEGEK